MPEDIGRPEGLPRVRVRCSRSDKVRAVGDRVAFVVAETEAQARTAAELIEVDYEMLPAVISIDEAVKPGAPQVWDDCPGNVAFALMFGDKEATDAAFASARHVVVAAARKQPRHRQRDRAARRDRRLLRRQRQLTRSTPRSRTRTACARSIAGQYPARAGDQAAGDLARRRRRLRHEVRRLSGGRAGAVGVAPHRPPGEMDLDARGSLAGRHARPRSGRCTASSRSTRTARSSASARSRCTRSART